MNIIYLCADTNLQISRDKAFDISNIKDTIFFIVFYHLLTLTLQRLLLVLFLSCTTHNILC